MSRPPTDIETLDGALIDVGAVHDSEPGHDSGSSQGLSTEQSGTMVAPTQRRWVAFAAAAAAIVVGVAVGVVALGGGSQGAQGVAAVAAVDDGAKQDPAAGAKSGELVDGDRKAKSSDAPGAELGAAPKKPVAAPAAIQPSPAVVVPVAPVAPEAPVVQVTSKPAGATVKTASGILLGSADGLKLTSPPLKQGDAVTFILEGYRARTVKIGFPVAGAIRRLPIKLERSPTLKLNLTPGIDVVIDETQSHLGESPVVYVLTEQEAVELDTRRRLTLTFTKAGFQRKSVVVSRRKFRDSSFTLSVELKPVQVTPSPIVEKATKAVRRASKSGRAVRPRKKKRALPTWNP